MKREKVMNLFFLVGMLFIPIAVYLINQSPVSHQSSSHASSSFGSLGQPMWNGASSYLFGTNNTEEWGSDNFISDPHGIIQSNLKSKHFTLMRSFFFHYTIYGDTNDHRTTIGISPQDKTLFSGSQYAQPAPTNQLPGNFYEIEKRVGSIENSGMACLGVLPSILTDPANPTDGNAKHTYIDPVTGKVETDLDFDKKVVAYLGNRCNLYEFGNEPDYNGISLATYEARWNEFIPILKSINPNAKFIGPVTANFQGLSPCTYPAGGSEQCYMNTFLNDVGSGKVTPMPDAISFHNYSDNFCNDGATPGANCLAKGPAEFTTNINQVRSWMTSALGKQLPLGITEWSATPNQPQYLVNDPAFAAQYTTSVLQTMAIDNLDFATQFDAQDGSGYCYLDMFNSCAGTDQPTGVYTGMANAITQYYSGLTPTPTPTVSQTITSTVKATVTPTPTVKVVQTSVKATISMTPTKAVTTIVLTPTSIPVAVKIVGTSGTPAAGTTVTVINPNGTITATTTDKSGYVSVTPGATIKTVEMNGSTQVVNQYVPSNIHTVNTQPVSATVKITDENLFTQILSWIKYNFLLVASLCAILALGILAYIAYLHILKKNEKNPFLNE